MPNDTRSKLSRSPGQANRPFRLVKYLKRSYPQLQIIPVAGSAALQYAIYTSELQHEPRQISDSTMRGCAFEERKGILRRNTRKMVGSP